MSDPDRLANDPIVKDAIAQARADVPDEKRLAKIAAGVTTMAVTTSAFAATTIKMIAGVVIVGAIAGGAYVLTRNHEEVAPTPLVPSVTQSAPTKIEPLPSAIETAVPSASSAPKIRPSPVASEDPEAEMKAIDDAQRALASDPARALSICDAEAKAHPSGSMAQEREVIAIDALVRLGRMDAARSRAAHFHATWPSSAHGPHVDNLVHISADL